jgi:hypothetical protein
MRALVMTEPSPGPIVARLVARAILRNLGSLIAAREGYDPTRQEKTMPRRYRPATKRLTADLATARSASARP